MSNQKLGRFWTHDRIANTNRDGEYSNLFGRRAACKDQGLSGAALRACKKGLRQEDKGLSFGEKRDLALDRKIGEGTNGSNSSPATEGTLKLEATMMTAAKKENDSEDLTPVDAGATRMADNGQGSGRNRTGLIIGISVGVLALIGLAIYIIKKRKK